MAKSSNPLDVAELQSDIHGERVAKARVCDYCGATLDRGQPVMYDVVRVADMPNLEQMFDLPSGWFPEASRCRECERETVAPATDGFDEALVMVNLVESNGVFSIDATSTSPVDCSPDGDGHYPPHVNPIHISRSADIGLARWIRVKWMLKYHDDSSALVSSLKQAVKQSPDVPPDVQL